MSSNTKPAKSSIDILEGDARDVALKYSTALRTCRHAMDKHSYALARFGAGSPMSHITERQLNEARGRFMNAAENYIRHAELLKKFLAGGLDNDGQKGG